MKKNIEDYNYNCLNEARDILKSIGMPPQLYNPRCAMTLAACAEIKPGMKWKYASENYHGTHDIIRFINENFPNKAGLDKQGYQENSRETFRDETLKKYVTAAIMETKFGLASNDKNNSYRFTAQFAALLRAYGTDRWQEELNHFLATHNVYSEKLKQVKDIEKGYPVNFGELAFSLGRSPHNKLQKQILEEFVPLFASGAELLYIGDTSDRQLCRNDAVLNEVGISVFSESTKMPDIVLYDRKHKRIIFIEAYSSTGEFNIDRVEEIKKCCHCGSDIEVSFITAFATTKKMLSVYPKIAWDTEIWVEEDKTHMTHKNGDKYLGRKL